MIDSCRVLLLPCCNTKTTCLLYSNCINLCPHSFSFSFFSLSLSLSLFQPPPQLPKTTFFNFFRCHIKIKAKQAGSINGW
ncbi:hypothetical protein L1987_45664 [Smallanthus sonchifolius]|uniref:Uncharacterized protein n=1 Tax=Smallanthus sonchifolius TaxID=185202 RepID=A0ACB9FYL3_9ASTR|nr:hypothetical protein L1987_45664 [Smallanthus sonchifolius]